MKTALCVGVLAWLALAPVARADDDEVQAPSRSEASSDDSSSDSSTTEYTDRGPDDFTPTSSQGDSDGASAEAYSNSNADTMVDVGGTGGD